MHNFISMKIICLTRHLKMGGLERQMAGLAVMLKGLGHDVQVVTFHGGDFSTASWGSAVFRM